MEVSFFKGLKHTTPEYNVDIEIILNDIKTGKWKNLVIPCFENLSLKNNLPCFTPTGIFSHRSIKGMVLYNGNFCFDLDKIDNPGSLKSICKNVDWIYAAFISPSRKGLKLIVKSNTTFEDYKKAEENLAEKIYEIFGVRRDNNCKDISRIHFISYDPELYLNENASNYL